MRSSIIDLDESDVKLFDRRRLEVWENQRWIGNWDASHLFSTDGPRFRLNNSSIGYNSMEEIVPERGWVFESGEEWEVETNALTDEDGWRYGFNVTTSLKSMSPKCSAKHFIRVRLWRRIVVFNPIKYLNGGIVDDEFAGASASAASSTKKNKKNEQKKVESLSQPLHKTYQVWENQRWVVMRGFSDKNLFPTDPAPFTDTYKGWPRVKDPELSEGWQWVSPWRFASDEEDVDEEGWSYAFNWLNKFHGKPGSSDFVRRRRWIRDLVYIPPASEDDDEETKGQPDEENDKVVETNFEIITGSFLQELMTGETDIPENGQEKTDLVQKINQIQKVLVEEEKNLVQQGRKSLSFLDLANRQKQASGVRLTCASVQPFREWLEKWEKSNFTPELEGDAGSDDILHRARALDERITSFLLAREHCLTLEDKMKPGASWDTESC